MILVNDFWLIPLLHCLYHKIKRPVFVFILILRVIKSDWRGCHVVEVIHVIHVLYSTGYRNALTGRQVQKSDRINSDRPSGSDQLGSTRIIKKTKLNEIETFNHLKVKIPVKSGPNKQRLAAFLRVVPCSQAAILYSKCIMKQPKITSRWISARFRLLHCTDRFYSPPNIGEIPVALFTSPLNIGEISVALLSRENYLAAEHRRDIGYI